MNKKTFLSNDADETGSICWRVSTPTGHHLVVEADIKIYDCSRSISLDFDCWDQSQIVERIAKADVLLAEIQAFKEELVSKLPNRKFFY